jgi:hypothetical protein
MENGGRRMGNGKLRLESYCGEDPAIQDDQINHYRGYST